MAYVDKAIVLVDNDSEIKVFVEPGFTDDSYADALEFSFDVKGSKASLRLDVAAVRKLARELVGLTVGAPVKLTFRRVKGA